MFYGVTIDTLVTLTALGVIWLMGLMWFCDLRAHAYIYKVGKSQKSFKKMQKIWKKPLTKGDVCDIMSLPLPKGFFVVRIFSYNSAVIVPPKRDWLLPEQREVHRRSLCGRQINFYMGGAAKWLLKMRQESELLWHAQSANKEIMIQKRTRRMTPTDWSSRNSASSAASTQCTKRPSNW